MRSAAALLFLLLATCSRVQAGAWTQPAGGYYLKLAPAFLRTSEEFDYRGRRQPIAAEEFATADAVFTDFSLSAYLEYGLRQHLTLIAQFPFRALRTERQLLIGGGLARQQERLHTFGIGDLTLALRHALRPGPLVISLQTGLKLPSRYARQPTGPPLGTGEVDGEFHLQAGRSLYPLPAYFSASLGYRRRGGPLHDEWLYAAELGWTAGILQARLAVDGIRNTATPPDIAGRPVVTPLPGGGGTVPELIAGDQHVTKLSATLACSVRPGRILQAELLRPAAGTNALGGTTWVLGLVITGNRD